MCITEVKDDYKDGVDVVLVDTDEMETNQTAARRRRHAAARSRLRSRRHRVAAGRQTRRCVTGSPVHSRHRPLPVHHYPVAASTVQHITVLTSNSPLWGLSIMILNLFKFILLFNFILCCVASEICPPKCQCIKSSVRCLHQELLTIPKTPADAQTLWVYSGFPVLLFSLAYL